MTIHSYPFKSCSGFRIILTAITVLFLAGCGNETDNTPPSIVLLKGNGYIADSITVPIGFPFKIGFDAKKGDAAITNLVITLTTENGMETALDSGIYNQDFSYKRSISYGASRFEKWSFMIRDKNGKSASTSVTIWKDTTSAFGAINFYPSVKLITQNDLLPGSFLSISDGLVFTSENAGARQADVNIITYWGDKVVPETGFTLSSPGESDVTAYFSMISNWTAPLNETRYKTDSVSISHADFDMAYNDSLIISNYTSTTVGKRKFKMVRKGYVIPFQVTNGTAEGKRGLIKINQMQDGADGYIIADVKVQK